MVKKKETAEQKLLKMIEAGGASTTEKKSSKKVNVLSLVKVINKFFVIGIVAAVLLLVYEVQFGLALVNKNVSFDSPRSASSRTVEVSNLIPTIQRISFYLSNVKRRNFFKPYEAIVKNSPDASENNRLIARATADLKLVGVSWMDAVATASIMVEDKGKDVTYFLKKGEKIGNIVVKTIYADSAVLGYENEEIIIRYDKSQM